VLLEDKRVKGQRAYPCCIAGCSELGRKFGSLGSITIAYCAKHRKIGEKILNFLFDSKKKYFRSKLLYKLKHSLMFENEPKLCESCEKKLIDFMDKAIVEIDTGREFIDYEYERQLKEPFIKKENRK